MASHTSPTSTKTLQTSDGTTYTYISKPAAQPSKPTFLLLHGFPSSSFDWRFTIRDLSAAGYGVIAPDLLGYGGTDKPVAKEEYAMSRQCGHIAALLEKEGFGGGEGKKVVGVAHDWGCGLLSRLVNYQPQYFSGFVFLSVAYGPPRAEGLDLDAINNMTTQAFGYPAMGYWHFFIDPEGAKIADENTESLLSLAYSPTPDLWKTNLCPLGEAKKWVQSGRIEPPPSWLSEDDARTHAAILKEGGWTGPMNWYKQAVAHVDAAAESKIPPENIKIHVPALFIAGEKDCVGRADVMQQQAEKSKAEGLLTDVEVRVLEGASHWIPVERAAELFSALDKFVKTKGL